MKTAWKVLIIVVAAILALIILFCGVLACYIFIPVRKVDNNIAHWQELQESNPYLPTVSEIGNYEDLNCKYQHRESFLFSSDAYILKASYLQEEFDAQRAYLESRYFFQESVTDNTGDKIIGRDASFTFDGYDFKMLSLEEYNLYYPKYFAFVGFSEERKAICFVFFDDMDLDFIDCSFEDFLIDECGWE